MATGVGTSEGALLKAAQAGDENAFANLVEPYRGELNAHCYRMLGSPQDAEDTLQETMLRAWKALAKFEGRSSLRSWLYTIATNTSLNAIEKRPKRRVHPIEHGPRTQADPNVEPSALPVVEQIWIEPYPDEMLGLEDGSLGPDALYERRESIELAFVAALQLLPPSQRAVLILREVLGYSARETAATLETSVASVNSALQRARATIEQKLPEQSQQRTAAELTEEGIKQVIDAYVEAFERQDIDEVVGMLTADAVFSMPPMATWYGGPGGPAEMAAFLRWGPLSGEWEWYPILTSANGQPALGYYAWLESENAFLPFALNILSFSGDKISDVTCFICRSTDSKDPLAYARFPEEPVDPRAYEYYFGRFGLPPRISREDAV